MHTGLRLALAACLVSTMLAACGQKADSSPLPDIPATVPASAPPPVVAARPASGTPIASAPASDVAGEAAITGGGAETSDSKSTGPGNGSTAVGGVAGSQK